MISNISLTTKANKKHVMSVDSYARWMCLAEALQYISENAKKKNIDLEKNNKWIKPLSLQKYIKERLPSMTHDIKVEENLDFDASLFKSH